MRIRRWALIGFSAVALVACGQGENAAGQGPGAAGGGQRPPPPPVGVVSVEVGPVPLVTELPGRLEARREAQVRARVSGIVQQRLFDEGTAVKAGQPLFKLDAGTFDAQYASAQAAVARAEAAVAQAKAQLARNQPLVEAKAISQQEWLATQTAAKVAAAELRSAEAATQAAGISRDYTTVRAPIAGRISRALVSEGALVSPADPVPLARIQQVDPLYVNFQQPAADVMRLRQAVEAGQLQRNPAETVEVRVVLADGSEYPHPGKLLFTDPTVDPATGQVTLRAELPNAQRVLLPGLFVRVRLTQAITANGIRLPQQAVTRDAAGDTVLVVGEGNKPMPRTVRVGGAIDGDWVVLEGLKAGERVIVDGFQKMFVPGAPVTPVPWKGGGAPAAGGGAAPPASTASAAPSSSAASR